MMVLNSSLKIKLRALFIALTHLMKSVLFFTYTIYTENTTDTSNIAINTNNNICSKHGKLSYSTLCFLSFLFNTKYFILCLIKSTWLTNVIFACTR